MAICPAQLLAILINHYYYYDKICHVTVASWLTLPQAIYDPTPHIRIALMYTKQTLSFFSQKIFIS
jgi:hypothetical protein